MHKAQSLRKKLTLGAFAARRSTSDNDYLSCACMCVCVCVCVFVCLCVCVFVRVVIVSMLCVCVVCVCGRTMINQSINQSGRGGFSFRRFPRISSGCQNEKIREISRIS